MGSREYAAFKIMKIQSHDAAIKKKFEPELHEFDPVFRRNFDDQFVRAPIAARNNDDLKPKPEKIKNQTEMMHSGRIETAAEDDNFFSHGSYLAF
jgi:hypothetical protein